MKRLMDQLEDIKISGKPGFMMHMVAGYPDLKSSEKIAFEILDSGADLLEVQIPFSDPVADGPVIAQANEQALGGGVSVEDSLLMIERIVKRTEKSILIMTYFNIVHHYGIQAFCERAAAIGVQGLIIPDYPFDEDDQNELIKYAGLNALAFVQVVASTTRADRMEQIFKHASGFVYCMARTGTTGKKTEINPQTEAYLNSVRKSCNLPIAVGFGLSDRKQVQALEAYADIIVVGSALIREYADKPLEEGVLAVRSLVEKLTHP